MNKKPFIFVIIFFFSISLFGVERFDNSQKNTNINYLIQQNKIIKQENQLLRQKIDLLVKQHNKENELYKSTIKLQSQSHKRTIYLFLGLIGVLFIISVFLIRRFYKNKYHRYHKEYEDNGALEENKTSQKDINITKELKSEEAEKELIPKEKKATPKFDIANIDLFNISKDDIHHINSIARIVKHKFDKQSKDWYILGLYQHIQNQLNSSTKYLLKAIKLNSQNQNAYILVGLNCQKLGDHKYVIEYMEIANSIEPSYKIFLTLGLAYKHINEPKRAINSYNSAIRLNPKSASTYNNIGKLYQATNNLQYAKDFYTKALELDDTNPLFYSNLGIVNSKLGHYEEAMKLYKKSLEFKENQDYQNKTYCDNDDFKDALKEIKTTIYNIPSSDYDRLLKLID